MNRNLNRRDFLKIGAAAGASVVASGIVTPSKTNAQYSRKVKIGFVGVGGRGTSHLRSALRIEGVEIPALCDIKNSSLYNAKRLVEAAGQPEPRLYGKNRTDFKRLCEQEDLDVVICCTSWEWHTPVCLSAMKNSKNAVSEVPIVITVDEAWELVETYENTGKWATLGLENYRRHTILNMVRKGLFGDVVHAEGEYVHDLRGTKFNPSGEPWRLQHSADRNGNLYPDHPMASISCPFNINHGDRFDFLVSVSSRAKTLNEFADLNYGEDHPYATKKMALGDYNQTILRTIDGKLVTLNFDTNTPHPRSFFRLQGTKAIYMSQRSLGQHYIYIDGISPRPHQWESPDKYFEEYEHPIIKNHKPKPRVSLTTGSLPSSMIWERLIQAIREDRMPDTDVYDSITSSVISPLSEISVANRGKSVDFPDFTKGKWKTRPPIEFV